MVLRVATPASVCVCVCAKRAAFSEAQTQQTSCQDGEFPFLNPPSSCRRMSDGLGGCNHLNCATLVADLPRQKGGMLRREINRHKNSVAHVFEKLLLLFPSVYLLSLVVSVRNDIILYNQSHYL